MVLKYYLIKFDLITFNFVKYEKEYKSAIN